VYIENFLCEKIEDNMFNFRVFLLISVFFCSELNIIVHADDDIISNSGDDGFETNEKKIEIYKKEDLVFDKERNLVIDPKTNNNINGIVKDYYEDGKLKFEIHYKGGRFEGISKYYYENGKLISEAKFKNGKLEGISVIYYESGALNSEINYKNGEMEGSSKFYLENGKICSEVWFKNNHPIHGRKSNGIKFTHAELINFGNGVSVYCE